MSEDKVITKEFMLCYPAIFEPRPKMENPSILEYGVTMAFPEGTDLIEMKKKANEVGQRKFKDDWEDVRTKRTSPLFRTQNNGGFRIAGKGKNVHPEWDGMTVVKATSREQPEIRKGKSLEPVISTKDIKAGDWCIASVVPFAYDKGGGQGVSFALHNIVKLRDGVALGSRRSADEDFAEVDLSQYDVEEESGNNVDGYDF